MRRLLHEVKIHRLLIVFITTGKPIGYELSLLVFLFQVEKNFAVAFVQYAC